MSNSSVSVQRINGVKEEMIDWALLPSFRHLYFSILEYKRYRLLYDVLLPWTETSHPLIAVLSSFRQLAQLAISEDHKQQCLWEFYALSRISDYLLLPFQSKPNEWDKPALSRAEYVNFFEALGFSPITADTADCFSSFHHEIIEVEQLPKQDDPITVMDCVWPGLRFGDMLFSRCGVIVTGGSRYIRKDVAESSTLYFTHRRLHRPTNDLSMGWGSNSQWRTAIRRDYECNDRLYYNVDGSNPLPSQVELAAEGDRLAAEERLELCRNRCFIRTTKPHTDLWPYDDRYDEIRSASQTSA
jgi:hypothetical protein